MDPFGTVELPLHTPCPVHTALLGGREAQTKKVKSPHSAVAFVHLHCTQINLSLAAGEPHLKFSWLNH